MKWIGFCANEIWCSLHQSKGVQNERARIPKTYSPSIWTQLNERNANRTHSHRENEHTERLWMCVHRSDKRYSYCSHGQNRMILDVCAYARMHACVWVVQQKQKTELDAIHVKTVCVGMFCVRCFDTNWTFSFVCNSCRDTTREQSVLLCVITETCTLYGCVKTRLRVLSSFDSFLRRRLWLSARYFKKMSRKCCRFKSGHHPYIYMTNTPLVCGLK